jgi:type VI secretion system secreted protein VgrG
MGFRPWLPTSAPPGRQDFEFKLQLDHPEHEYCVQYRESDFDFVSRIMAQEGIFYYFRHEDTGHVMVIADHADAYFEGAEPVDYPHDYGTRDMRDHIKTWEHAYRCHSGRWSHTDFDFENPDMGLMSSTRSVVKLPDIEKSGEVRLPRLLCAEGTWVVAGRSAYRGP